MRECYERGAQKFGWTKRNRKPGSARDKNGNQTGWGMATAVYPAMQQTAAAHAVWDKDGFVTISSATHEIGTGTYTTMSQIAANSLRVPLDKIRFQLGDSNFPEAPVNGGSWLTASVGPAVIGVCEELKKKRAANALDWDNLAEEIESLGTSNIDQIESRLENLILHVLKWKYQPDMQCGSWRGSIFEARSAFTTRKPSAITAPARRAMRERSCGKCSGRGRQILSKGMGSSRESC